MNKKIWRKGFQFFCYFYYLEAVVWLIGAFYIFATTMKDAQTQTFLSVTLPLLLCVLLAGLQGVLCYSLAKIGLGILKNPPTQSSWVKHDRSVVLVRLLLLPISSLLLFGLMRLKDQSVGYAIGLGLLYLIYSFLMWQVLRQELSFDKRKLCTVVAILCSFFVIGVVLQMTRSQFRYYYVDCIGDEKKEVIITGMRDDVRSVTIPATIHGHQVAGLELSQLEKLEELTVSDGVYAIDTINYCSALKKVNLPDNLHWKKWDSNNQNIVPTLFECNALESVTIPVGTSPDFFDGLEYSIKLCSNCKNLKEVIFTGKVDERMLRIVISGCPKIERIVIPDGVKEIGYLVLEGHPKELVLPDSVEKISKYAINEEDESYTCLDPNEWELPEDTEGKPNYGIFYTRKSK